MAWDLISTCTPNNSLPSSEQGCSVIQCTCKFGVSVITYVKTKKVRNGTIFCQQNKTADLKRILYKRMQNSKKITTSIVWYTINVVCCAVLCCAEVGALVTEGKTVKKLA